MRLQNKLVLLIPFIAFLFTSCEKVIDVKLKNGTPLTYADAWITDAPGVQQIKLFKATDYLSTSVPEPVTDAQVQLTDLTEGKTYNFQYANGVYSYNPGIGQSIGIVGHEYKLQINYKGDQFEAIDQMKRIVPIDSITYEFKEEENGSKEGYEAEFHAKDAAGQTDYYWIRTYLNGKRNRRVSEMYSIDGSFYEGIADGFSFIPPFTQGISNMEHPYKKGDRVKVLLRSLSKASYEFIEQAANQLESDGMFDKVPENIRSNIKNMNSNSSNKIIGWFGMTAESTKEVEIQ